jgi:hypothetical protein
MPNLVSVGAVTIQKTTKSNAGSGAKKACPQPRYPFVSLNASNEQSNNLIAQRIGSSADASRSGSGSSGSSEQSSAFKRRPPSSPGSRKRCRSKTTQSVSGHTCSAPNMPKVPKMVLSRNPLSDQNNASAIGPVEGGHPRLEFVGCGNYRFDPGITAVFIDSSGAERRSEHIRVVDTLQTSNSSQSSRLLVMPPPFFGTSGENGEAQTTVYFDDSHGRHGPLGTFTYIDKSESAPQDLPPDPSLFNRLVEFVREDLLGSSELSPSKKAQLASLLAAGRSTGRAESPIPSPNIAAP